MPRDGRSRRIHPPGTTHYVDLGGSEDARGTVRIYLNESLHDLALRKEEEDNPDDYLLELTFEEVERIEVHRTS